MLLQVKEEVMKQATRHSPRAILALDLKGAFDNVSHASVLSNLQGTGCGERVYNYVRDFLTDRQARIKVGEEVSPPVKLGSQGTPQGSVLSPLLFNMALLGLPKALGAIEGLGHALYADDISLWTTKAGSLGWIQDTLQAAADVVDKFAKGCGLRCSPSKSALVIIRPRAPKKQKEDIKVSLEGEDILPRPSTKILGLVIQADNRASIPVAKLKRTSEQILHMLRRVASRTRGLKERDTLRLVQAFVVTRITYVAPYLLLNKADTQVLDVIIRKAVKQAIGVPMSASTCKLLEMGLHNSVDELIEAHLANQKQRLSQTKAGRRILQKIGWKATLSEDRDQLPDEWLEAIKSKPIPKNMNPAYHGGRREARARALNRLLAKEEGAIFTDASMNDGTNRSTATVTTTKELLTCASAVVQCIEEAEELAIALALTLPDKTKVVTDSQQAYRSFQCGWVSRLALRVLKEKKPPKETI